MLLWKRTFQVGGLQAPISHNDPRARDGIPKSCNAQDKDDLPPWSFWPRPPNGFIDLGCVCTVEKYAFRMLIAWLNSSVFGTTPTPPSSIFATPFRLAPNSDVSVTGLIACYPVS